MKYVLTLLSLIILSANLSAQVFTMNQGSFQFEDDLKQTIHVKLEPDAKETSKAFRKYLKNNHDVNLGWLGWKSRNAEEIKWEKLTGNSEEISVYTHFEQLTEGSAFHILLKLNDGKFMDYKEDQEVIDQLETITAAFLQEYLTEYLNNKIDNANAAISELDSELKGIRKDYNKNKDDLDKNGQEIKELQLEIQELEKENKKMSLENEELKESLETKEKALKEKHEELFKQREKLQNTKLKLMQKLSNQ